MISRHPRALSLDTLTEAPPLLLLGAGVVLEDMGLRESKGVHGPLRPCRIRPEVAG